MTKEEAIIILKQVISWRHDYLRGHPKIEYIAEAIEVMFPYISLPSKLDEAAEAIAEKYATRVFGEVDTHNHIDHNGKNECRALYSIGCIEGFKAGADWQLNKDSEKHYFAQLKDIKDAWQELKKSNPGTESKPALCFHKGAEWMAGQGNTFETIMQEDDVDELVPTCPDMYNHGYSCGDKVIVQIRKKE